MAPGLTGKGDKIYQAGHNLIKAHAKAYHIYVNEFKKSQKGQSRTTQLIKDFKSSWFIIFVHNNYQNYCEIFEILDK